LIRLLIFTNALANSRYAGGLDDEQDGGTIVMMNRVREAIAFNVESVNESTWLWLASERMGFPMRPTCWGEHEKRTGDLDSSPAKGT